MQFSDVCIGCWLVDVVKTSDVCIGCWLVGVSMISFLAWFWRMIQEEERLWNAEKERIEAELEKYKRREEQAESIILEGIKIEKFGSYNVIKAHPIMNGYYDGKNPKPSQFMIRSDKYGIISELFASREEAIERAKGFCAEEEHGEEND